MTEIMRIETCPCSFDGQDFTLAWYRDRAKALCALATGASVGVTAESAIYIQVTERRGEYKGYSSCADLAHWMLFNLGVRLPLINREEHHGWTSGVNVSRLAYSFLAVDSCPGETYYPGDILIVWSRPDTSDAHVLVVSEHWDCELRTAEYGLPGGRLCYHRLPDATPMGWSIGTRRIRRVLRLPYVIDHARSIAALVAPTEPLPVAPIP